MGVKFNKNDIDAYNKQITVMNVSDMCEDYNKIYSANTNILRFVPWLYSGLKVCETRILYALYDMKAYPDSPKYKKVQYVDGETIGKYHPHGSVYGSIVGMAQPWNNNCELIERSGNFGSAANPDDSAAGRYIECKLSKYSYKCFFEEFDPKIVDMKTTYGGDLLEPEFVLPSKYPNLLINGSFAIGLGLSSSFYPCNFNEVCELTMNLIEDPDYPNITLYPDIPTKCNVIDNGDFKEICETGKGKYVMRGEVEINEKENYIRVLSIPMYTSLKNIHDKILELVDTKVITGIKDFKFNNTETQVDYKIILKPGADPYQILQILYKKTKLQDTKSISMVTIDDYEIKTTNVRDILNSWITFRRDFKRRILNREIVTKYERIHILDILLFILNKNNAEKTVKIVKGSKNKKEVATNLMKAYGITSLQATSIAEMKIYQLNEEASLKYKEEREKLQKEVDELTEIVKSNKKIDKIIKEELREGMRLFGAPRKTKIINIEGEQKIKMTKHTLVFTANGFIKKLPLEISSIGAIKDGDVPTEILHVENATSLLLFDESGKITKLEVSSIANTDMKSYGLSLNTLLGIEHKIIAIKPCVPVDKLKKFKSVPYVVSLTKNGVMKKTKLELYMNINKSLSGAVVKDDDKLVAVKIVSGNPNVIIYTDKGFGNRKSLEDIKETNRLTMGSKVIKLEDGESVIGYDVIDKKDKGIFVLTSKGNGKISELKSFPLTNGESLRITSLSEGEHISCIKTVKGNEKFKVFMKNTTEEINIEELPVLPRLSKCKKIIGVRRGEVIIDVKEAQ